MPTCSIFQRLMHCRYSAGHYGTGGSAYWLYPANSNHYLTITYCRTLTRIVYQKFFLYCAYNMCQNNGMRRTFRSYRTSSYYPINAERFVPTFAVRETASLGIMGSPRVPPLNPSESIVISKHYRL